MARTSCRSFRLISAIGPTLPMIPALFTRISTGPALAARCARDTAMSNSRVTSPGRGTPAISQATARAADSFRSKTPTFAPAAASLRAIAAPIPCPAPVTRATLPASEKNCSAISRGKQLPRQSRNHARFGARRRGIQFTRDPPGQIREPAGGLCLPHGVSPGQRVTGTGDSRVEEYAVATHFHREAHVAGSSHAGINDHRIIRIVFSQIFQTDADVIGVQDSLARADRAAGRHHRRCPGVLQPFCRDRVVGRVTQHLKALGDELFGGLERGDRIGQQGFFVAEHFQLHPVGARVFQSQEDFAAEPCHTDGIVCRKASGRVRQDRVTRQVNEIEDISPLFVDQPLAADSDSDDLRTAGLQAVAHQIVGGIFSRADDQPRFESMIPEHQRRIGLQLNSHSLYPPPTRVTTSSLSPSSSTHSACRVRGTSSKLRSTARYRGCILSVSISRAIVVPGSISRDWPFIKIFTKLFSRLPAHWSVEVQGMSVKEPFVVRSLRDRTGCRVDCAYGPEATIDSPFAARAAPVR